MSSLGSAFDLAISLKSRVVEFERPGKLSKREIQISPSNYSRYLSATEQMAIEGDEFVVSVSTLAGAGIDRPKRGDTIRDPDTGSATISEVRPMFGLGDILGYRCRTA